MITSEETHSIGNSDRKDIQVKGKGVALVEGNVIRGRRGSRLQDTLVCSSS